MGNSPAPSDADPTTLGGVGETDNVSTELGDVPTRSFPAVGHMRWCRDTLVAGALMPIPKKLLQAAFATLSPTRLARAAEHSGLRGRAGMSPGELSRRLGSDDGTRLRSFSFQLTLPELRAVSRALGIRDRPTKLLPLRAAVHSFVGHWDQDRERERAAAAAPTLPQWTVEALVAEAASLRRPVVHLNPCKRGDRPIAVFMAAQATSADGERPWLSVDLRGHPDEAVRRDGVLEVYADDGEGSGRAVLRTGRLRTREGVPLRGTALQERPPLEVLFRKASQGLRRWLDQMKDHGWDLRAHARSPKFPLHGVIEGYDRDWQSTHPLYTNAAYAQLGGWPLVWPEESALEQSGRTLVLRTYREAEPWVEVFQSGRRYEVLLRIT
jgi:hypothetical protein